MTIRYTSSQFLILYNKLQKKTIPLQFYDMQVIEGLFHLAANEFEMEKTIYVMNHYTAGVILFGERAQLVRQKLSKVSRLAGE